MEKHRSAYRAWIQPVLGHRKLGTITPEDLRQLLEKAKAAGKGPDTRIAIYQTVNMLLDNTLGKDGHRCRSDVKVGTAEREREIHVLTTASLTGSSPRPPKLIGSSWTSSPRWVSVPTRR